MNRRKFLKNAAGVFVPACFGIIHKSKAQQFFYQHPGGLAAASSGGSKTPDQVTGLLAWYKGDAISGTDGAAESSFTDSSGNGHTLNQAAGFTLHTAGQNSLNVARFNGTTNAIGLSNAAWPSTASPFSIFIIFKTFSTAQGPVVCNWAGGQLQIDNGSSQWDPQNPTDTNTTAADTSWHTWGFVFNGASSKWRKDGGAWTAFSANPGAGSMTTLYLGAGANGTGSFLQCDIGEVAVYSNAVGTTGSDGDALFLGLKSKWATF